MDLRRLEFLANSLVDCRSCWGVPTCQRCFGLGPDWPALLRADSLLSRLPLFPVKLLPLLHPLLLLMPLPMSRLLNCLNHQRIAPSRKLRE